MIINDPVLDGDDYFRNQARRKIWSHTSLSLWDKCPWKAHHDHGLSLQKTDPMEIGSLVHAAIEAAHLIQGDIEAAAVAIDPITENAKTMAAKAGNIALSSASTSAIRQEAEKLFYRWLDLQVHPLPTKAAYSEARFALDSRWNPVQWDSPKARFRLVVDLLKIQRDGEAATIKDYKTDRRPEVDWTQLERYAAIVARLFNVKTITLIYDYIRFDWQPSKVMTPSDLEWVLPDLERRMASAEEQIEAHESGQKPLPARAGIWCGDCAHRATCPILKPILASGKAPAVVAPSTQQEAVEARALARAMQGAVDQIKANTDAWVSEVGPLPTEPGKAMDLIVQNRWDPDVPVIIDALLSDGVKSNVLYDKLSLTKAAAQELASIAGWSWEQMEKLGSHKPVASIREVRTKRV